MSSPKIYLVQGDTQPALIITLTMQPTMQPFDVSSPQTNVRLKFRQMGATALTDTLLATKLSGTLLEDGTVSVAPPYDVPGFGGRVRIEWNLDTLSGPPGAYEGEIETTLADGSIVTVFDRVKFQVREQFL